MREIKFRGKSRIDGEWFYGNYTDKDKKGNTHVCNLSKGCLVIDPDTVGQYTGLKDRDGNEMFEGDVVQFGEGGYFYVVEWSGEDAAFLARRTCSQAVINLGISHRYLHIVGNIHDNPGLLQHEPVPDPEKSRDYETLLPGEFCIKGLYSNGCMCQPDVIYVARLLTRLDGRGKKGRVRIWSNKSYVEDGRRYGWYCDWDRSTLQNYEILPDRMSPEAREAFKGVFPEISETKK